MAPPDEIAVDCENHQPESVSSIMKDEGQKEEHYHVRLYRAALSGNWEAAKEIHNKEHTCFTEKISSNGDTALHIAAAEGWSGFVKELLLLPCFADNNLESKNGSDNTAFCLAAASGVVDMVQEMVEKNSELPKIRGSKTMSPILMAALLGHEEMVKYLMPYCYDNDDLNDHEKFSLFISVINADMYDLALDMLDKNKKLANFQNGKKGTPLHILARKTQRKGAGRLSSWTQFCNIATNYLSEEQKEEKKKLELVRNLWRIIIKDQPESISTIISHPKPHGLLFVAIELGNYEFVSILIRYYPDLIWETDSENRTIFHAAVQCRQEKIYSHIHEMKGISHLLAPYRTSKGYSILHLAAILPSPNRLNVVSGPAFQMQRELLWFQEVEGFIQRGIADAKSIPKRSNKGETPRELFTKQHANLRKEGEKWMRDTSTSCMVVATLVAAVVFQAIIQPPNKDNEILYRMFVISDAFSLVASTASILTFLAILTSRYAQEDFLVSLPRKLIIGLTLLFVSIMTMLLAFIVAIAINFPPLSLTITIAVLAGITGSFYILQHFPLLADAYRSTFRSNYLFRPPQKLFRDY